MIIEVAHFCLILALCVALVQSVVPMIGAARNRSGMMQLARSASMVQFVLVAVSLFGLMACFALNDFSVAYVAANSNSQLPLMYRLCAVWGAHEGSMLLWVFILTVWMAAVSVFSRRLPQVMMARTLAVLAMIAVGFYAFILTVSNPFARLLPVVPGDGRDLNPILQDPGMLIHPPMLYMGYVGFAVVFAFSIAALIGGQLDAVWARWTRPWTTVAWCFLTYGIVLGSWWAYRELGWGGWWFWDPVENASLLPWLAGTALLHALAATEKRGVFKSWTALMAITAFSLSLLGTFLVRSGVLISVHAFALDPLRGQYMLIFLCLVVAGSLLLYALRAKHFITHGCFSSRSREMMLLLNNVFLTVAMLTVLLGTLYPLLAQAVSGIKLSVGAPYFNLVFIPLMVPFLFLLGIGPYFRWQHSSLIALSARVIAVVLVALCLAIGLPLLSGMPLRPWAVLGLSLGLWILLHTLNQWVYWSTLKGVRLRVLSRSQWAMVFAHCGVAVTVIGVTMVTQYQQQLNLSMRLGEQVQLAGYTLSFDAIEPLRDANYRGAKATFLVTVAGQSVAQLQPEQRIYTIEQLSIAKTAISVRPWRDLYVALGAPLQDNSWSVRIYYKPFVRWIWFGGLLMVLGGLCAVFDKRYRVKRATKEVQHG